MEIENIGGSKIEKKYTTKKQKFMVTAVAVDACLTHALPCRTKEQAEIQHIHSPESRHFQWLPRHIVEPCFQSQSGTVTWARSQKWRNPVDLQDLWICYKEGHISHMPSAFCRPERDIQMCSRVWQASWGRKQYKELSLRYWHSSCTSDETVHMQFTSQHQYTSTEFHRQ